MKLSVQALVLSFLCIVRNKSLLIGFTVVAILILLWSIFGNEQFDNQPTFKNETEARVYLRSKVASGQMSEVEARLRLAEIITKQKAQKKGNNKRGEITKEEAIEKFKNRKAIWKNSGKAHSPKKQ